MPSFNAQAFGGDTANLTLSARLRGLAQPSPGAGQRQAPPHHRQPGRPVGRLPGAAAADLGFIPMAGIGRIRSADRRPRRQYGTDAIAGVVNIILKKNPSGARSRPRAASMFRRRRQDGRRLGQHRHGADREQLSERHGRKQIPRLLEPRPARPARLQPGQPGYSAANNAVESQIPGYPNLNLISGDAEYRLNNLAFNAGVELPMDFEVYSFGTLGLQGRSAYENYRRYNRIQGKQGAADRPLPLGFSPRERIIEDDYALTLGALGQAGRLGSGPVVDLRQGRHRGPRRGLGQRQPLCRHLDPDGQGFHPRPRSTPAAGATTQWTNNLDLRRGFDVGLATPLDVAFGYEQRRDTYRIGQGDAASTYKEGSQSYPELLQD
ncbi:hypothetical protein ACRAWD_25175 [Caulobacter segnis]